MESKILTLAQAALEIKWNDIPLTVQAVRYRIKKAQLLGYDIKIRKATGRRGRMVEGISQTEVKLICKLWKNLHA